MMAVFIYAYLMLPRTHYSGWFSYGLLFTPALEISNMVVSTSIGLHHPRCSDVLMSNSLLLD